ncbi:MAG: 50S ribosomal protein L3 [Nitrospirota bacterium]
MIGGLLGRKLGMTQVFGENGRLIPVTVVQAGPCRVVQVKTPETDGYRAVQLSFDPKKESRANQPLRGHYKKANVPPAYHLREFPTDGQGVEVGQTVSAEALQKGEWVSVSGISKGKGFAGVMKRHHFSGGPATHGSMFHRQPGSIGASSFPSRVFKGKRLPGHMGAERVTVKGLEVIDVRAEENLVLLRGAIPGPTGSVVEIRRVASAGGGA